MVNFWQMQVHPGNAAWPLKEVDNLLQNYSVIGMGEEWDNDGGVPEQFKHDVHKGDIVIIRHQSEPRYLVEVIEECIKNEGDNKIDVWFGIYRKVKILSNEGPYYKSKYAQDKGRSWSEGLFAPTTFQTANNWDFAKYWYNDILNRINMELYKTLLSKNHNLILTGAPGTGKTYLAKQIAEAMGCTDNEIGFVQFHPSYDYTDFVEGLRPVQDDNGNVGFERKNGVFKAFCAKALETIDTNNFDSAFDSMLEDLSDEKITLKTPSNKKFAVSVNSKGNLVLYTGNELKQNGVLTRTRIKAEFSGLPTDKWWKGYYKGVVDYLVEKNNLKQQTLIPNRPFVFIIDEINRGEISKIFGELFFSIDPGYRGEKGRVQTQYQNLVEDSDVFKKGFFVPKNVYIIGTMNDIDRSVESMDFAFRRRFAFKEIKANDEISISMLDKEEAWGFDDEDHKKPRKPSQDIVKRIKDKLNAVNYKIWHEVKKEEKEEDKPIEGFSSAYHIGASYFLKLVNYRNENGEYDNESFKKLWEYHIKGLLLEYLRGMTDVDTKIEELHTAYNNESEPNNGQQQ